MLEFLIGAIISLIGVILIASYILTPYSKKIARITLTIPLISIPAYYSLLKQVKEKPSVNYKAIESCISVCSEKKVDEILYYLIAKNVCLPESSISLLEERGLVAHLLKFRQNGCNLGEERNRILDTLMLLTGEQTYTIDKIIAYCSDEYIIVKINDTKYDTRKFEEPYRSFISLVFDPTVFQKFNPRILISWGCKSLDLRKLAIHVLPEVYPDLVFLKYHLGIEKEYDDQLDLIEAIAARLKYLINRYDLDDVITDYPLVYLRGISEEKISCPENTIITNKPRYACPYYSPYKIDLENNKYSVLESIVRSLKRRQGNPLVAVLNLKLSGYEELADSLLKLIRLSPSSISDDSPVQLEPYYIQCIMGRLPKNLQYSCIISQQDCINWNGPGPYEMWAARLGINIEIPDCMNKKSRKPKIEKIRLARVLSGSDKAYNISTAAKIILSFINRNPENKYIIITPDLVASSILSHYLESYRIETQLISVRPENQVFVNPHTKALIIDWDSLLLLPEILVLDRFKIYVFPERYSKPEYLAELVRRGNYRDYLDAAVNRIAELISSGNSAGISSTLYGTGLELIVVDSGIEEDELYEQQDILARDAIIETSLKEAEDIIRERWGPQYKLRRYQSLAIKSILHAIETKDPQPVMVILPTGAGKSAIFQLSGLILSKTEPGYVLVVSPLRALIRDQVESLQSRGFIAVKIDSATRKEDRGLIMDMISHGVLDFLYITPERFYDPGFVSIIARNLPSLIVLDEAHTISKWGTSFRPAYLYAARTISDLYRSARWPPIALFTASASNTLVQSILTELGFTEEFTTISVTLDDESTPEIQEWSGDKPLVIRAPSIRPNLIFHVSSYTSTDPHTDIARNVKELSEWASSVSEPWLGIIFTSYVKSEKDEWANVETLAEKIKQLAEIETIGYHGQLSSRERRIIENMIYKASRTGRGPRVIVATKAFGMGMDLPNIRWILHVTPSDGIEDYYQEVGRAGRDGLPARVVSLYDSESFDRKYKMIASQKLRLSYALLLYNTLVELTSKVKEFKGGWPLLVLPTQVIGGVKASKSLDMLRSIGRIDYWQVTGELSAYEVPHGEDPSEYFTWYMPISGNFVIAPRDERPYGWKKAPVRYYICESTSYIANNYPIMPIKISIPNYAIEIGGCKKWRKYEFEGRREPIALIQLSLDMKHDTINVFDPEEFAILSKLSIHDIESFLSYRKIIEQALRMEKPDRQDSFIKEELDRYLSAMTNWKAGRPPKTLLYSITYCPTSKDCIGHVIGRIVEAQEWLDNPRLITLAVQSETVMDSLREKYRMLIDEELEASYTNSYRRILAASRGGIYRLLDYGYIILVIKDSKRAREIIERIRPYPYSSIYVYNVE